MVAFHYIVKAKLIQNIDENGEIKFTEIERKFENKNPIVARTNAFEHYQSYIDILLQGKGKTYSTDKKANEELTSFVETGNKTKIKIEDEEIEISNSFGYGIGVFMIIDSPISDETFDDKEGEEIFIHGLGEISYQKSPDNLIYELQKEFEYYKFYNYEIQNNQIEVVFCNSEEWAEGYLGNGEWLESYHEPNTYLILQTPFDWKGFDKPYWWGETDGNIEYSEKPSPSIEEIIEKGEGNQIEFKPSLLYNFSTKKAGIGVKNIIAKVICSFLNSNGGILIIGLKDDEEVQGLSYDYSLSDKKNEKDFFKLEFDQMLKYFLSFSVKSNISSNFYQLNNKDIFVVIVSPSKRRPIFLNGQNEKEFYVRGEASSRQLTDIEELTNYCIEKWGT